MVLLWTDILMYLLFFSIIFSVLYIRRKDHLRRPWKKVVKSKVGVVSMFILATFLVIGLLDSIHYKSSSEGQVISLFDDWVSPIRTHSEKTYSAPFAVFAYAKEMQQQPDGKTSWSYPPLIYGGAHLLSPADKSEDILAKASWGGLKGMGVWLVIAVIMLGLSKKKRSELTILLKYSLISLFLILTISFVVAELSSYYHVLGTDKVGEDVLYQGLKSIRTGLVIGSLTTFVMLPIAIILGLLSGFFRGWVDDVIQYIYTTLSLFFC